MTVINTIEPSRQKDCRCYFCGESRLVKYIVEPDEIPSYAPLVYVCETCVISFSSDERE